MADVPFARHERTHSTADVLGVHISALDLDGAVEQIGSWIEAHAHAYVTVTGVHGVMESRRDPELRQIHNAADMSTCDGMPMVWSCRWAGFREVGRVYGPDLVTAVVAAGTPKGWKHFFYGGNPSVADDLARTLRGQYPSVIVGGTHGPPFREDPFVEDAGVIDAINSSGADVVWIGLSTPKQERWMAEHRHRLDAPVLVGVGAAFDLLTGRVPQAPRWIQRSGFEWLYRLAREPRRLTSRYLRNNPRFVTSILREPPRAVERSG